MNITEVPTFYIRMRSPLTVEDMLDLRYDGYSRECSTEETVFLKRMDVFQTPRYNDENGNDYPMEKYLICYQDRLVEIGFDWEPVGEHMAIVGETLGRE